MRYIIRAVSINHRGMNGYLKKSASQGGVSL